ncbi:helix-turn-helix domain-containing protein [Lysinibacillus sphaericus]|uniref:helix-turn-helix domain-containing protein n=1 Tax=Lysinibacillus sphaericus TaxID=1421 RepID=UPI003F79A23C
MIRYKPKKINILISMAKKGFNQKELSNQSKLDPSTLSTFFNGKRNISPGGAKKIADALDSNVDELFDIEIEQSERIEV